jgi:hypothetical protein
MTVTCHFLKEKKLVSTFLDTLQLAGTHTAENISTCPQVCVFKTVIGCLHVIVIYALRA